MKYNRQAIISPSKAAEFYRFVEFGKLSSSIFHDLLNPLATVSLTVERLRGGHDKREEACEMIERAIKASQRIGSFVEIAKKELDVKGKLERFSPKKEICDAIELLSYKSMKADVQIGFRALSDDEIFGNSVKFFQVAVNLLSNAIDSYRFSKRSPKTIEMLIENIDGTFFFEIRDHGCGIPYSLQEVIFDPFFTTKPKDAGIGLGLSTVKEIIESDFGGMIHVQSSPKLGSIFALEIPVRRA